MASQVFKDATVLVDGNNFTGQYNSLDLAYSAELNDATVFNSTTRKRVPGLVNFEASYTGFFSLSTTVVSSTDDSNFDSVGFGHIGSTTNQVLGWAANDWSTGQIVYFSEGVKGERSLSGAVGELLQVNANWQSNGQALVRGQSAFKEITSTGSVNGPVTDLGAASTDQALYAALFVTRAGSTTGTLDVIITSDTASSFPSASTRITFAQVTNPTAEFKKLSGAITDTAYRAELTHGGSAPDFDVYVGFAVIDEKC